MRLRLGFGTAAFGGDPRDEGNELEKVREVDAGCLGWFLDDGFRVDEAGLFLEKPKRSERPLQEHHGSRAKWASVEPRTVRRHPHRGDYQVGSAGGAKLLAYTAAKFNAN